MAFGIPGSSDGGSSGGAFLSRIQYDARSGFYTNVDRVQGPDGAWADQASKPYPNPTFAVDFGSMEVGYVKFAKPPTFLVVPYLGEGRTDYPLQPDEMVPGDKPGDKPKKAFQPGFRLKVMSQKTFGDGEPRYFAGSSKALMGGVDALYREFIRAPEAAAGKMPVVTSVDTKTIETKGPKGTTKNYQPIFSIVQWIDRPAGFGERTVPPPGGAMPAAPRPAPVQQPAAPPPAKVPAMAGVLDDEIPFAPEFR
jgi:hypothetical protein